MAHQKERYYAFLAPKSAGRAKSLARTAVWGRVSDPPGQMRSSTGPFSPLAPSLRNHQKTSRAALDLDGSKTASPRQPESLRARLQGNDLVIQAVCPKRIVEAAQKLSPMAGHEIDAADLPLLQDLVGIEGVAQQFGVAS